LRGRATSTYTSAPFAAAGDPAGLIAARADFLAAGHYDFVPNAVADAARSVWVGVGGAASRLVVDAGAGTGFYLGAVLDALPNAVGLALDASKPALRRAARAHPRAAAAGCDIWRRLPLADGSARLVLNIFAPRNGAEFSRVLATGGALIVVTPTGDHLAELVGPLQLLAVDPEKDSRLAATLGSRFAEIAADRHDRLLRLRHSDVQALVAMGPSARHLDAPALSERIAALPDPVSVTASVDVRCYRSRAL
jgi:23S rRNA (guanine745-N1)-methyltransferase